MTRKERCNHKKVPAAKPAPPRG